MKKWYEEVGPHGEIVLSTRIRLARNYEKYPFPGRMDAAQRRALFEDVSKTMTESAGGLEFTRREVDDGNTLEAQALMECHLISPELVQGEGARGAVLSRDERVCVMVGEEDHLRIQVLGAGLCLADCMERAWRVDDLLESIGAYAFEEKLGYLTRCPTNLGTGLRASVMLHLPALTETGYIRDMITAAGKLGFAVRGLYGEGSRAFGALYQLSNQVTLGLSEEEIIERLGEATENILRQEQDLRQRLARENPSYLDRLWRAAGTLASARSIAAQECMELLSLVRTGVALGELKIPIEEMNRLLRETQSATLSLRSGGNPSPQERDALRAAMVRETGKKALLS